MKMECFKEQVTFKIMFIQVTGKKLKRKIGVKKTVINTKGVGTGDKNIYDCSESSDVVK